MSKTLRSGNMYDQRAQLEKSAHEENVTGEAEKDRNEGNEDNSVRPSPVMVDDRIKVSFEPLHAQISALTEMMDRLIQRNSTKIFTTASIRELRH